MGKKTIFSQPTPTLHSRNPIVYRINSYHHRHISRFYYQELEYLISR